MPCEAVPKPCPAWERLILLSLFSSISKGPAFMRTATTYFSAGLDGTRHECAQVKPQPYSNLPRSTTSPSVVLMVNCGGSPRDPLTSRFVHTSPATPTSDSCRRTVLPSGVG